MAEKRKDKKAESLKMGKASDLTAVINSGTTTFITSVGTSTQKRWMR